MGGGGIKRTCGDSEYNKEYDTEATHSEERLAAAVLFRSLRWLLNFRLDEVWDAETTRNLAPADTKTKCPGRWCPTCTSTRSLDSDWPYRPRPG